MKGLLVHSQIVPFLMCVQLAPAIGSLVSVINAVLVISNERSHRAYTACKL